MFSYRLHPEAEIEYEDAYTWYGKASRNAAINFIEEVDRTLVTIQQFPNSGSSYIEGTRRLGVHKFPYTIIYIIENDQILVIAVAHQKRRPGYWKHCLPEI